MTTFTLNGNPTTVDLPGDTPLLWVIREHLRLTGTKYGCGISQCGACTVLVNGSAIRSCVRPLSSVEGAEIITIEGLHPEGQHPLQKRWVTDQVPQCGYCQSGAIMQASDLLDKNPSPSDADIVKAMNGILCRCMTYPRIKDAIKAAAKDRLGQKDAVSKAGSQAKDTEAAGRFAARSSDAGGRVRFAYETVGKGTPEGNFARNLSGLRWMPGESLRSTSPRRRWGSMWTQPWPRPWPRSWKCVGRMCVSAMWTRIPSGAL